DSPDIEAGTLNLTQELFEVIGFRNVDMAELRIHTPAERVAIAEGGGTAEFGKNRTLS
ncbi:hypothetical protein CLN65_004890, partial [Escherichia coli]|nr:hypothetical protein [Escherichia coli]